MKSMKSAKEWYAEQLRNAQEAKATLQKDITKLQGMCLTSRASQYCVASHQLYYCTRSIAIYCLFRQTFNGTGTSNNGLVDIMLNLHTTTSAGQGLGVGPGWQSCQAISAPYLVNLTGVLCMVLMWSWSHPHCHCEEFGIILAPVRIPLKVCLNKPLETIV